MAFSQNTQKFPKNKFVIKVGLIHNKTTHIQSIKATYQENSLLVSTTIIIFAIKIIINKNNYMKTSRFIWRIFLVPLVTMLCAFFVAPLQAQGQNVEAYVQMSADKTTLTFFYDIKRTTREGTTWGIEEKQEEESGLQQPAWAGTYKNPNTTTTKAVVDASFKDFRPTSTEFWFKQFKALTAIEGLQYLNTTEVIDMGGMFTDCAALTSLDLKNFNTSNVTDMNWMFNNCSALTSLDLTNFNTENVTNMSGMFRHCSALTSLSLKNFNTSEVTNMNVMFSDCSSLTSLDLSNFNTSNVTGMNGMFYGCSALKSLDLSSFNTSNVTDMNGMFAHCAALTSLDLKNFNTSNVTNMDVMFSDCSSLTTLALSNFNTSNVTEMNGMFDGCSALKSLDLSSFNTSNVTDMSWMFASCSKLASIVNNKVWKCEESQEMFEGCTALKGAVAYDESKVDVTMANPETGYFTKKVEDKPEVTTPEAYVQMSADKTTLTFFYDTKRASREGTTWGIEEKQGTEGDLFPAWAGTDEKPDTTTTKAVFDASFANFRPTSTASWFQYFKVLTAIEGLQSLNTSEVTDMSGMFYGCSVLTSLDLKSFNTSNVTDMNYMFGRCSALTSLNLSNFNTSNVTDMGYMFGGCSALTSLNLSNFNTSNVTDMGWMFHGCSALTSLNLSNFNTSNVTDMGYMFHGCSALTSLSLKSFNTEKVTNMSDMFAGCNVLTSLVLSNFNTSNVTDMGYMFGRCSALTSLDLSHFNTEKVTHMRAMFVDCSALTSLDLKNFYTEKVEDMGWMFAGCLQLVNIVSNKAWNCEKSQGMFDGCTALKGAVSYDENKTDATMANPETGYFTKKIEDKPEVTTPEAYVQRSADKTTLTFFYDTKRATREGTTWGIEEKLEFEGDQFPAWLGTYENPDTTTTKAVVDASFANFRPTSTASWFQSFEALAAIEGLQNLNTSEVTNMRAMFNGCSRLTNLDLSSFNTSNVTDMGWMFNGCSALTSLDLKNFNTSNVTDMSLTFKGCSTLTTLELKNFNTSNVTDMSLMFKDCSALKSLDLKNFNTSNVTDMSLMFNGCSGLKSLDLSNFNISKVTNMGGMFYGCSKLASIVCDKAWNSEYSYYMFKDCTALKGAVAYDESKTDVTMANPETGYFTKKAQGKPEVTTPEAYVQMSADKTTLTFYYDTKRAPREGTTWGIEEKQEVEKRLEFPAWAGTYNNPNKTTTKVVFDASFKDIHPTSTGFWFKNFKALTAIEGLQNLNTSEVTDMSVMFAGCSALTSLDLKNFNTSKVTNMSGMFEDCSALTSLDLSNFNTSNVALMTAMFEYCSALTSLDLKGFKTEKIQDMKYMFNNCSALTSLDLSHFNTEKVEDMSGMFAKCSKLASIVNNKTWNCEESQDMFKGCTALKGAVAYDENKTDVTMANSETGYFTKKVEDKPEVSTPEAYVQMSADKTTLTFFYDTKRATREGTTWGIEETQTESVGQYSQIYPAWSGTFYNLNTATTKAVFDDSFANFRPTSTAQWLQSLRSLINIEGLHNLNTSEVTDMHGMFAACSALTTLDLSTFNTSNVTKMFNMFNGCTGLKALDLKNFNTEKVEFMSRMFKDCSALTSLDLSNFNTSNVIGMNGMFEGCSTLKELDLKSFNTSNVTNMSGMFAGSSALTSLDLKGFNTEKVKYMVDMFYGCSKLASIISNKAWNCEQSQDMFKGCTAIKGAVAYDESKTDVTMANPETGYFTKKAQDKPEVTTPEAYVQMSADQKTLTFFYDTKRATREGTTWGIEEKKEFEGDQYPAWTGTYKNLNTTTTKAVVDASFKDFRPTNTAFWFRYFKALTAIEGLQYLNTSEVKDMSGMFAICESLTALDLSSFNTSNVTYMRGVFSGCESLKALDLSSFNPSKVTEMTGMFFGCSALTSLGLKNFNTEKVKDMDNMFYRCSALTSLDLKSFNTTNVTNMSGMFYGCSALKSLDLQNFNTEKVEDMSGMFAGCSSLTSLDLKSFNTSNVTNMGGMFHGCFALKSLDLQNFNTEKVEEMREMFAFCSKLANIINNKAWNSKRSQDMFEGCTALKGAVAYDESKVDVTMANPETGYFTKKAQDKPEVTTPEAYVQMSADKKTLTFFYDTKRTSREGTTWGIEEKKEFEGDQYPAWTGTYQISNYTITKAVFDDSFANFRPTSTAQWLQSLRSLINIEGLQNLNTSEVTDMHGMFAACSALTSLDLKTFNTSSVTNMSDMFAGCKALTALDLSNFNTSNVTNMNWMFTGCFALTTLDLSNFNTSNVTDMSDMFVACYALKSLDLQNFNTEKVEDMSYMFRNCSALKSLDLQNFNTEKVKDMSEMFAYCSKLASIISNKTWKCEQSQDMFKGCTALKGAVAYDESKVDVTMANPETGYFTKKTQDKPEVTTPEAYVQMSADKTTLTFFYDTKRATREGTTWDITSPIATRSASLLNATAWGASEEKPNSTTTKVVFDASFAKFYPKTTAEWFAHYAALKRIEGIENLNTSEVTSMKGMFTGCAALDTLDLTSFNTEKVNDMSEMFKNCANLSTVVCDKVWSTPHSEQMFYGCVKLLGKAAFDANKTSVEMANPNSGYFVAVKPTALLPVFSPAGANGIYTLQGKRVRGNLQHLPAGVYIVNGKKVVVQ